MAKQILNDVVPFGEQRTKINSNFTEVYDGLAERLPEIGNYSELRSYSGQVTAFYVRDGLGIFRIKIGDTTSADNGGTIIVDTVGRRWFREFSGPIFANWFGAKGGGASTDSTAAFNSAVLDVAKRGGGTITVSQATSYYYVPGKVLVPSNVVIDLNGQTLRGADAASGVMFETATLESGTLVSNIGSTPETKLVFYSKVKNGQIQNVGQAFNFYNFVLGCALEDLHFENVNQAWKMARCFYAKYSNITARGGSVSGVPTYWFYDNTNAVNLTRVSATTEFAYLFEGGTTATTMTNCTAEGGANGIKFKGDVLGFTLDGNYFENMPSSVNGTALDFSEAGTCYINFKSNYFNYIDTVIDDGGNTGTCTLFGSWDESNSINNVGATLDGNTYRGLAKVAGLRNHIRFILREAIGAAQQEIPANWQCSKLTNIVTCNSYGGTSYNDIRAKSYYRGIGIVPVNRGGDVGEGYANKVPFAEHYALVPGSSTITVVIDTQIKWQPNMLFAKFALRIVDANSPYFVFGEIYGDQVKQLDSTGKNVTINANIFGNLQLRISTFTHPSGTYFCTGSVQIVG